MNSVNPASSLPVVGVQSDPQTARTDSKEDFLKLLVAQLRYQDPLNPLQGSDFAAQLAQFSSLEELRNIGGKLDYSVESNMMLARAVNNTMAATLIGKSVRAVDDRVIFDGQTAVDLRFNLSGAASSVKLEIVTETGQIIRTLTGVNLAAGDSSIAWDGRDTRGNRVPAGTYTANVSAQGMSGNAVQILPIVTGRIQSVRFEDGNPVIVLNGRTIPFGSVLEILEGQTTLSDNTNLLERFLRVVGDE
ncbi:MAG: hypothetical protein FJY65_10235 [Calditrichaeota bacterium]|nr:hypothetical protein [Calditrichota bacterium]